MATLKEKLQDTINKVEAEKVRKEKEANDARLAAQQKIKNELESLIQTINNKLIARINDGQIPSVAVRKYDDQQIIALCNNKKHTWQQLWDQFIKDWENEGLRIVFGSDWDNDRSWTVVKVEII